MTNVRPRRRPPVRSPCDHHAAFSGASADWRRIIRPTVMGSKAALAAIAAAVAVAAPAASSAFGRGTSDHTGAPARSVSGAATGVPTSRAERTWIKRTIAGMTLREEVGQLFEINGYGESVNGTNHAMVALNRR